MRTAHVRCGDDLRETLVAAGFPGDFVPFTDPVSQGPVPRTADPAEFDAVRADWLASAYDLDRAPVFERLSRERAGLDALDAYDRVVLWFEHDWFDQAILIRLLTVLARRPALHERLRLLSIGAFPGEDPFIGFGQLSASQLATLAGRERPVAPDQFAAAERAWAALSAPDPVALAGIDGDALPYLRRAVARHLAELPWTTDGLSLSERLCLRAVSAGPLPFPAVFQAHQDGDPLPYLGDVMLLPVLRRLHEAERPALASRGGQYQLTAYGQRILHGDATWQTFPRWVGGVLLPGWRWDPAASRPVPD
ncbi:DUF1835 domain-containing protein [Catellatospora methionotrophica]|uniref:DUF1835 domain-containing protein n=1 Tax=Catellatospora methionotrophica TaxID=121620 RepID=UPI00340D72BD